MQCPILSGVYVDTSPDFRTSYPRNLVPVPKQTGISAGYLKPADGLEVFGTGPGVDRGSVNWNGTEYRVMGTKLVSIDSAGIVTTLGDVQGSGQVTFDYSFDRLGIASNGILWYWDGGTLTSVTDPDIGVVIDFIFIDGYFMTTDGTSLIVTDLGDPYAVNPLKYGSSELDPDPVMGLIEIRGEAWAVNRNTIESFRNIGGSLFPFQRIDGAQIMRGAIGTFAFCLFVESVAFVGSGRNESPAVWLAGAGTSEKISTREIDTILQNYTEAQLSLVVCEARVDKGHQHLWIRLPDQTLVFDGAATAVLGEPVWFHLTNSLVGLGQYRAQNLCWVNDAWHCGDPQSNNVGLMVGSVSTQYGEENGWDFGTVIFYNEGNGAVIHDIELVGLPGYAAFGADPTIWTSYSLDGSTFSVEKPISAGQRGQTAKRLAWRRQGKMRNWRIQKFRGTTACHQSYARLEIGIEPLKG